MGTKWDSGKTHPSGWNWSSHYKDLKTYCDPCPLNYKVYVKKIENNDKMNCNRLLPVTDYEGFRLLEAMLPSLLIPRCSWYWELHGRTLCNYYARVELSNSERLLWPTCLLGHCPGDDYCRKSFLTPEDLLEREGPVSAATDLFVEMGEKRDYLWKTSHKPYWSFSGLNKRKSMGNYFSREMIYRK